VRFGRIIIALVIIGAIVALGAYWIGPGVVPRARLHLVALDAESRFGAVASLPAPDPAAGDARQPLILAVRNDGARESGVHSISLSAPGWIRFYNASGPVEPTEDQADEPLRKFVFTLGGEPIDPGALPQVPAGLDRMWVAADVPAITCRLRWDDVPELAPAPPWNADALDSVVVFYSIEGERERHTGVLTLGLDRAGLPNDAVRFTSGDPVVRRPGAGPPPTDSLTLHGERNVTCGAPGRRVALHVTVWNTATGRNWILSHESLPRRILFDVNGDGLIDRESWDGDADGFFEAVRTASFAPPDYLMPGDTAVAAPLNVAADSASAQPSAPRDSAGAAQDTVPPDTAATDTITPPDTAAVDTVAPLAGRTRP
jgi:hypothetical protein